MRRTILSSLVVALSMCLSLSVQAHFSESYDAHQTAEAATLTDVQIVDSVAVEVARVEVGAVSETTTAIATAETVVSRNDVNRDTDKHVGRVLHRQGLTSTSG